MMPNFPCPLSSLPEAEPVRPASSQIAVPSLVENDLYLYEHRPWERGAIETFIRQRFEESYGARLTHFMPRLFSICEPGGAIIAGFGLREASEPLFLEHYLDQPIEARMVEVLAQPIQRAQIVEVGQFAGLQSGAARTMIRALTAHLFAEGFRWVSFTGTTALRNAFRRLHLQPVELARANITRLSAQERWQWGSYYDNDPRVLCGNIAQGYAALQTPATEEPRQ